MAHGMVLGGDGSAGRTSVVVSRGVREGMDRVEPGTLSGWMGSCKSGLDMIARAEGCWPERESNLDRWQDRLEVTSNKRAMSRKRAEFDGPDA